MSERQALNETYFYKCFTLIHLINFVYFIPSGWNKQNEFNETMRKRMNLRRTFKEIVVIISRYYKCNVDGKVKL
jgi:hypothetical protein